MNRDSGIRGDPAELGLHTQNVKNTWMYARHKMKRQFGSSRTLLSTYLKKRVYEVSYGFIRCPKTLIFNADD